MAKTNAQKQRAMRQDELRELISKKGLVQQVLVDIKKLDDLASLKVSDFDTSEEFSAEIGVAKDKSSIIKTAIDSRMRLVNKYLPDVRAVEVDVTHDVTDEFDKFLNAIDGKSHGLPSGD